MPEEPVKQHYIPRFLLKNFGEGKKNKEKIWTFDKFAGRAFRGNVIDAAHENRFYEATTPDGDTIKAEPVMGVIDGWGGRPIRSIVAEERLPLDDRSGTELSHFVAAQLIRGPHTRNQMQALFSKIIEKWGKEVRFGDDPRPIGDLDESENRLSAIAGLREVPEMARILRQKIWFLMKAPLGSHFILSDEPVVRHNYYDYGPMGSSGISQKGIEIYLPLSPRLALHLLCPEVAELARVTRLGPEMLHAHRTGLPIVVDRENVEFANSLQVQYSERFLYARSESDFTIVRQMLARHPDLREPASKRTIDVSFDRHEAAVKRASSET